MHRLTLAGCLLAASLGMALGSNAVAQQSVPAFQDDSSGGDQSRGELFFVIQELRQEVQRLQGQVEQQSNAIERLTRQSRERYVDLDERILELGERVTDLEDGGQPPSSGAGSSLSQGGSASIVAATVDRTREYRQPDSDEREAYSRIQNLIHQERDYEGAIDGIYDFIDTYPEGDLTVNAYYWLGEVYLVQDDLDQARQAFTIVMSRFDDHRKAPDALYKLGITHDRKGEPAEARRALEGVISRYSGSDAEPLARQYLEGL